MQEMRDGSYLLNRVVGEVKGFSQQFRRIHSAAIFHLTEINLQTNEKLPDAVVEFSGNAASLRILQFKNSCAHQAIRLRISPHMFFAVLRPRNFSDQKPEVVNQHKGNDGKRHAEHHYVPAKEKIPGL